MSTSATPATRRLGRPPLGQPTLSRERILAEALDLVDEDGLEAVSMRKLAKRLGVDPMSLYHHVDGKEAILDGIAEVMLGSLKLPGGSGDLRYDVVAMARAFRTAMLEHPRAAPVVLTRQLGSTAALEPTQVVLASLSAAGRTPDQAVHILRAILAFLIGTLMRETEAAPTFSATSPEGARARQQELEASGLSAVAAAAPELARCDHEAEFEFGLTLLINAILEQP